MLSNAYLMVSHVEKIVNQQWAVLSIVYLMMSHVE